MGTILFDAVKLIVSGDREVFFIAYTSLRLATASTLIAALFSIPLGIGLHFGRVPFKRPIITVLSSLMAVPTVVIGLMVFSLLSRSGPLGGLNLLFTPGAIVIGQTVLVVPILTSLVHSGLSRLDPRFYETLITLGAGQKDILKASILEARYIIASALLAGFGRVIGEVGVSMMLGGNIRWYTRTMTTSIALETSKGQFELGLSLGLILLVLALAINMLIHGLVKSDA